MLYHHLYDSVRWRCKSLPKPVKRLIAWRITWVTYFQLLNVAHKWTNAKGVSGLPLYFCIMVHCMNFKTCCRQSLVKKKASTNQNCKYTCHLTVSGLTQINASKRHLGQLTFNLSDEEYGTELWWGTLRGRCWKWALQRGDPQGNLLVVDSSGALVTSRGPTADVNGRLQKRIATLEETKDWPTTSNQNWMMTTIMLKQNGRPKKPGKGPKSAS